MKTAILFIIIFRNFLFVNEDFEASDLTKYATVYRDSIQHTHDEILRIYNQGLFVKPPNKSLTFPAGPYYYYIHYTVGNTSSKSITLYSEVRNPHINQIQLYTSYGIYNDSSMLTGDYFPFDERELKNRFFVFETTLEPGQKKDFFLFANKYNESIKIPISIRSKNNFIENVNREASILGYYFGAILIILLVSIVISILSPRKINFLFIIYLLSFSLFSFSHKGLGYQYLWDSWPLFNSLSRSFFAMVTMVTILVFSYYFFEMKEKKRWMKQLHWAITSFIGLNWCLHIVYYTLIYQHSPLQYLINYHFLQFGVFIFPVYMLFLVVYQIARKNHLKYYLFLLSTFGMLGAVAIMMLGQIGLLSDHFILENIVLIALIVDFTSLVGILSLDLYNIKLNNQKLITDLDQAIVDGAKIFLKGQQIERGRLAQEIHDGTGMRLSSIQMKLSAIETEDNTQRDRILNDLSIVSKDLRKFSHNLSSVVLEQYGLINAIEELMLQLEDIYPEFTFEFEYNTSDKMDGLKEKELYFIINELINNTIKHSKGDQIHLFLKTTNAALIVKYQDNGIGIDVKKDAKGLGLKSIEWRIKILSGTMNYSQENGFAKYHFEIPM